MYGYLIAAGGCAAAAWRFRKLGARKRLYEAALLLAAGFFWQQCLNKWMRAGI